MIVMEEPELKSDSKICGVCGDKALGYNFSAVTCESCKAFFRRNALTTKSFKCPFTGSCEITTVTRRFCQKCRLEKCFAIGMRKDFIMSEEDKVLKRQKIEENKAKRRRSISGFRNSHKNLKKNICREGKIKEEVKDMCVTNSHLSSENYISQSQAKPGDIGSAISYINSEIVNTNLLHSDSSSSFTSETTSPKMFDPVKDSCMLRTILNTVNGNGQSVEGETKVTSELDNNNDQNCNHNNINISYLKNTIDVTKDVVQDVKRSEIEPNSIESILCEAIKLEFESYSCLTQCHNNSRELNDAERAKLNELIVAHKALLTPLSEEISNIINKNSNEKSNPHRDLVNVINLTAVAIRRLIKMAKKINAFKNMCQEDQVALLKGGCTEMMILRSAMNYDQTKETWEIPNSKEAVSNIKADILKLAKGNIYQAHARFMNTFDSKWRSDENIVLIMCAITLFTPDRPRVIHQDVVKLEQNSYYYLLRRYLESVYPGCEAKSTFLKLIQKISELHRLNEEVINVYLDVNPSDIEPLLLEIFDVTH